jgi:hypothetical protein
MTPCTLTSWLFTLFVVALCEALRLERKAAAEGRRPWRRR